MITLIHGDHTEESRNALRGMLGVRTDYEVRRIDGRNIDETELIQALEAKSLFGTPPVVVIENLLVHASKKTAGIVAIGKILQSAQQSTVILWESKRIPPSSIKHLGIQLVIKEFSVPNVIFRFLDTLRPGQGKTLLNLFDSVVARDSPELVHALIVSRIRQLILVRDSVEPEGLESWQVRRLTSQVRFFTMDTLTVIHHKLLDMEYQVKTGVTPFTLTQLIEQTLVDL